MGPWLRCSITLRPDRTFSTLSNFSSGKRSKSDRSDRVKRGSHFQLAILRIPDNPPGEGEFRCRDFVTAKARVEKRALLATRQTGRTTRLRPEAATSRLMS
jgi:hypothetical protein